jgi:hypothetical protein
LTIAILFVIIIDNLQHNIKEGDVDNKVSILIALTPLVVAIVWGVSKAFYDWLPSGFTKNQKERPRKPKKQETQAEITAMITELEKRLREI